MLPISFPNVETADGNASDFHKRGFSQFELQLTQATFAFVNSDVFESDLIALRAELVLQRHWATRNALPGDVRSPQCVFET